MYTVRKAKTPGARPWVIYADGQPFDSRDTLSAAREVARTYNRLRRLGRERGKQQDRERAKAVKRIRRGKR